MSAFKDAIVLTLQCRDYWNEECPHENVRAKLFTDFIHWVVKQFMNTLAKTELVQLLKMCTAPFSPSLYSEEHLTEKLTGSILPLAYRVAHAIDTRNGERDRRLRDLFEFIVKEEVEMNYYGLLCPAFTFLGESEKNRGKGSTSFSTSATMRFQQLLLISAIVEISSMLVKVNDGARVGKRKKSSKRLVSVPHKFRIGGKLRYMALRIGHAIQSVVKDWDVLASYLSFRNTEEMVLPYARICETEIRFRSITSKAEGFPPRSQQVTFVPGISMTSQSTETYPFVNERPFHVDEYLRDLTKKFLSDVFNSFRSQSLYTASAPLGDRTKTRTTANDDDTPTFPVRFKTLDLEKLQLARQDLFSFKQGEPVGYRKSNCVSQVCPGMNNGKKGITVTNQMLMRIQPSDDRTSGEEKSLVQSSSKTASPGENTDIQAEHWNDDICTGKWIDYIGKRMRSELLQKKVSEDDVSRSKDALRKELEAYTRIWCCSFNELEEIDEMKSKQQHFTGCVQLSFYDNRTSMIDSEGELGSLKITEDEMQNVVDSIYSELRIGGHCILFCTMLQYAEWVDRFMEKWDRVCEEHRDDSVVCVVDSEPLVFTSSSLPFSVPTEVCEDDYQGGAVQFAVHVTKREVKRKDYSHRKGVTTESGYLPVSFPKFVNVFDHVPDLFHYGRDPAHGQRHSQNSPYDMASGTTDAGGIERGCDLGARTKPQDLLKELIIRYSSPGDLVLDRFAGLYGVAEACITLENPRRFVGCERNSDLHSEGLDHVLKTFAKQIIAYPRKFKVAKHALADSKVITASELQSNLVPRSLMPNCLPPHQCFPDHILHSLANEWGDRDVLLKCTSKPIQQWPRKLRKKLSSTDFKLLLKYEAVARSVVVSKSTINHPQSGMGLFAGKSFQPQEVICSYYGTIVYADLMREDRMDCVYGHGLLTLDVKRFRQYALQLDVTGSAFKDVHELVDGKLAVFIVPASFCVGSIINDPNYVEGDVELSRKGASKNVITSRKRREANAEFVPRKSTIRRPRDLIEHNLVEIVATRLINLNEEIFVPYKKADLL